METVMTYVVLDIGAGSRAFAIDLRWFNRPQKMLILCGEPEWGLGPFFRGVSPKKVAPLIKQGRSGIHKITASYDAFGVPDGSLDMVSLNAPHPMNWLRMDGIDAELDRCLKPGELFFSSYPRYHMGGIPKAFSLIEKGRWNKRPDSVRVDRALLPKSAPNRFPQSPTVSGNIRAHAHGHECLRSSHYAYHDGISPGWMLWQKPFEEGPDV